MQDFVRDGRASAIVAEVMCYYLDWSRKTEEVKVTGVPMLPALL